MAIRRFVVVGEHASPEAFEEYTYKQLHAHQRLTLTTEEQLDDLAKRRGDTAAREFTLATPALHTTDQMLELLETIDQEGNFITIEVTDKVVTLVMIE